MEAAEAVNDGGCRLCCVSPWKRRRRRYPSVTVTLLMLLMMFYCIIRATAAAAHQSKTVAMAADDAGVWTPSDSVDDTASLSVVSDRPSENVGHGRLASLPRRDDSSGRDWHGALSWRTLIAVHRADPAAGFDGTGRRAAALARPEVVNNAKPPSASTTATTARVNPPTAAAAGVNVAPVITTPRGRHDRLPRIQFKLPSPYSQSSFSADFRPLNSFQLHDNSYIPASAPNSLFASSGEQLSDDMYPLQSKSIPPSRIDSGNKYTVKAAGADDVNTFSNVSEKDAGLEPRGGRVLHRKRRQRGVESVGEVDQRVPRSGSGSYLNAVTTSTDGTSTEPSVLRLRTTEVDEQVGVSMRAAALRYRSRGNFAALVDPLKSGRASASVGSASANRWRQLVTVGDNSASPPPLTEELTSSSATRSHSISTNDSDSIEISVLTAHTGANASAHAADSVYVATQQLNDSLPPNSSKAPNSSLAPSGECNCSKAMKSLDLQAALKLRFSAPAVAMCVYVLSFLFALVAAWSVISIVFSLCIRNQRSSLPASRRSSSQLVLGFLAMAAAARAMYYAATEYQLLAAVAPPGIRRTIYECWFPFVIAAFFVHRRLFCAEAVTKETETSPGRGYHIVPFRCDLFFVSLALCFLLAILVLVCLLIDFCLVPVQALFVLRFAFALIAVLLSVANVYAIAASSGRRISTQVAFCALFVVCAGFFAVDSATLLSSDFALSFRKNADVLIAVQGANALAELFIAALLCAQASSTIFRFQREKGRKDVNVGTKEAPTKANCKKLVNYRQASTLSMKSQKRPSWLRRLLYATSKKSKVVDVGSTPAQISLDVVHSVCWASAENPAVVHGVSPLPQPSRLTRSRSMLYNDHGFIRFRLDGDTDGESDARTLDDDDGGPGPVRSVPASEYASADDLSSRRGPSSAGTPRWSRPGSPSLTGFRAPSIHLQDSIDRALDRCDIWRVGCEQGQLNVDELRRIVQLYADVSDCRRGNHQRRAAGLKSVNYAEV